MNEEPSDDPTQRHALDSGGSFAYENWRAANQDPRRGDAFEYPLYSDASVVGEASFGPYSILNAISGYALSSRISPPCRDARKMEYSSDTRAAQRPNWC